jgi:DNA repair exonuclease SbcCD nuclease subunit
VKIVAVSDLHTNARTMGKERFDEVERGLVEAVEVAIDGKAGLFAFCGDLCDTDDARDVLRALVLAMDVAIYLAIRGVTSLWLSGNHDVCGDGETTTLEPLRIAGEKLYGTFNAKIHAATRDSCFFCVGDPSPYREKIAVLALPYSPRPYDADAALRKAAKDAGTLPLFVFSHLMLPDMHPGSESAEMMRGKDRAFPLDAMREVKPALVVQGHYHRGQRVSIAPGLEIHIPGSLARLTFGEERHDPGYLLVDTGFRST